MTILLTALIPNRILKVLSVALGVIVNEVARRIINSINGYKRNEPSSAAQFAKV